MLSRETKCVHRNVIINLTTSIALLLPPRTGRWYPVRWELGCPLGVTLRRLLTKQNRANRATSIHDPQGTSWR